MIEAALYAALGCAVFSALAGSRTAWALVPAVAFTLWMQAEEVAFVRAVWIALDVAAGLAVWGWNKRLRLADWTILALFPVAWALYYLPDPYRYVGSAGVTIMQLLLTFRPTESRQMLHRLVACWKANFRHRDEWTDLRARGADG